MAGPRVVIDDDHTLMTEALRRLLEPDCEVVGTYDDPRAFLRDVVIARAREIEPPKRSRGLDSPCPNCGFVDLVLPDAPGDVVLAVTTTPNEQAVAPEERQKGKP